MLAAGICHRCGQFDAQSRSKQEELTDGMSATSPSYERPAHPPGSFCWVGLATSDPTAAKEFYARVFDWDSDDVPGGSAGEFSLLRRTSRDVAILYRQTQQARQSGVAP